MEKSAKQIRLEISVKEAVEMDRPYREIELLDIIIDHFNCRHIEKLEDKMLFILGHKK